MLAKRLVRAEWAVAIAATVVAVILHLDFLFHAGALWRDELNSVNTASTSSLGELWRLDEFESFPMPWLIALRTWMRLGLGGSDLTLRIFGILGGLAVSAAVWFALRRLTRAAPLVSLAIIAVNPQIIRWDDTVRAWGLGAALAIVAMVLIWEASVALTRRRLLLATFAAVLAVQCTYQNAILLGAIVLAATTMAIVRQRRAEAIATIGIGAVAALSLLPYVGLLERRAEWNALGRVPLVVRDLAAESWEVISASGTVVDICGLALVVMGILAAWRWIASSEASSRAWRDVVLYASAAALLAALALGVFYEVVGYPTEPWYYTGLLTFTAVCVEVVASAVAPRVMRAALVALASLVLIAGFHTAWTALHQRQTNIDVVAARLANVADRADVIVVNPWYLAVGLTHYYTGGATVIALPPIGDYRVHRYDLIKAAMLADDPLAPALEQMRQALETGHKVWIVGALDVPPAGTPPARPGRPPLPGTEWNESPYEQAWSQQAGAFLASHILRGTEIPIGVSGGDFETIPLLELSGWK